MNVSLKTASEGFLSQECPECRKRFKVQFTGDGTGKALSFCPYCGHEGQDCWWTQTQADYFAALAGQELVVPELKKMAQRLERSSRGGPLQFKANVQSDPAPRTPVEADEPWPTKRFACCDESAKHDGTQDDLHCPICGELVKA